MSANGTTPAPEEKTGAAPAEFKSNHSHDGNGEPPGGDTAAAVEFLKKRAPEGDWALVAIPPDGGRLVGRNFTCDELEEMEAWIGNLNGRRNLYFHVNPLLRPVSPKAGREDVKELRWLHVDLDPDDPPEQCSDRAEWFRREQDRLRVMAFEPPEGVPSPTAIVFSGGGYQLFWRLDDPLLIYGDLDLAEQAKLYNLQLEIAYRADKCHNVDRIMRLPGTVNLPSPKKVKKGRPPALARCIQFGDESYSLDSFTPAQLSTTTKKSQPRKTESRSISTSARVRDLSDLDIWGVSDRIKTIVEHGRHPDEGEKEGDDSRSSWLFDCVCGLIRQGVPDEVILGLIIDERFGISESVREKGRGTDTYARRQIESGHDHVSDSDPNARLLESLNARYFTVSDEGGKARVAFYREVPGRLGSPARRELVTQSPAQFIHRFRGHPKVEVSVGDSVTKADRGKWWLDHPQRRHFERIDFLPGIDAPVGTFNLWNGFGVNPQVGTCDRILEHIRQVLADGDANAAEYIERWLAWAVQNPGRPAEVALVFRGGRGTGKSTIGRLMVNIFGSHGRQISSSNQIMSNFNSLLRDCALLFADEAIRPSDKPAESRLKAMITEPDIIIEPKGVDAFVSSNCLHIMMASNEAWVVPAGIDERRFAAFEVSEAMRGNDEYFAALHSEIEHGGREALLAHLLGVDLGDWHPRRGVPQNRALADQKVASLPAIERDVYDFLEAGELPDDLLAFTTDDRPVVVTDLLCARHDRRGRISGPRRQVQLLLGEKLGFKSARGMVVSRGVSGRRRGWAPPPLNEARRRWTAAFGFPQSWPDREDWLPTDRESDCDPDVF